MTIEQAEVLCEMIIEEDGSDAEVREDYSGRGMYGKTCVGVVTNASPVFVGWACGSIGMSLDEVPDRTDSMGLSQIIY